MKNQQNDTHYQLRKKVFSSKQLHTYFILFLVLGIVIMFISLPFFAVSALVGVPFELLGLYTIWMGLNYRKIPQKQKSLEELAAEEAQKEAERERLRKILENRLKFVVVGVTFYTGKKSRQSILRHMHFKDAPYDKVTFSFKRYDYEGELAIGVYVNDEQIGNVPRPLIADFNSKWVNAAVVSDYSVYGGHNGKNWGISITVDFT